MPDIQKVHQILQYTLLAAAHNDNRLERQLGPIHLIKYVYLADMDYARYHDGQTFTGINWKFHHYGPWSTVVFQQVDEALKVIGAERKTFASRFNEDDCVRWSIDYREEVYTRIRNELPIEIRHAVPGYVEKYRDDTTSLLHFVYATRPMLHAAPGEFLDFTLMQVETREMPSEYIPLIERLSNKKRKKLESGMDEMRERFRRRMEEKKVKPYPPGNAGKMDAVFEAGVAWLDGLAGDPFPEEGATIHFSDEVWKSDARSGDV
jgi:hypothetical protein